MEIYGTPHYVIFRGGCTADERTIEHKIAVPLWRSCGVDGS